MQNRMRLFFLPFLAALMLGAGGSETVNQALITKVKKDDIPIEVELSGVLQADNKTAIRVEPEEYSGDLIVKEIATEGTVVKEGEILLEFEEETLTRAINRVKDEIDDNELAYEKSKADRESTKIKQETQRHKMQQDLVMAQNELKSAEETLALDLEQQEIDLKNKIDSIKDQKVNLEQLTEMYEERELHTSTENILLERERRKLANSKTSFERFKKEQEIKLKYKINAPVEKKKLEVLQKESDIKQKDIDFATEIKQKEVAVQKAKRKVEKSKNQFEKLQKDLQNLKVLSPRAGVVFYGALKENTLSNSIMIGMRNTTANLRIGGRVQTHVVLMTIASMDKLSVEMKVIENDIQHMKEGLPVTIIPDAYPELKIKGSLTKVNHVAERVNFFSEVRRFTVVGSYEDEYPQLRAGMNCRVTVHADRIPDAVQVPVISVFEDDDKFYCYVMEGNSPSKREVKIGASNDKVVQITEGLKAGESVYLYNPVRD